MKKTFTLLSAALLFAGATAMAQSVVVDIQPTPGGYVEAVNWASGMNLECSLGGINIGSATCTYIKGGASHTETMFWDNYNNYMDQYIVTTIGPVNGHPESAQEGQDGFAYYYEQADKGTDVVIDLKDVTYNGSPVGAGDYSNPYVTINNGNISIIYPKPEFDLDLVSATWPEKIYSNMPSGSVGTLTFNEDIEQGAYTTMTMGSHVFGSAGGGDNPDPSFTIPTSVSGKTVTVDFSGINFAAESFSSLASYKQVTIMVFAIYSEIGQAYPGGANPYTINITWDNTTGVASISTEKVNNVYDLNGVNVMSTENGSDLNNLPAGMYIINGKKVVKK